MLSRVAAVLLACVACAAHAQDYPARPVRFIVGFPPGGGPDVTARAIQQKLSENLGQPVVVENRPGAAGFLAIERVARAAADGYTLLMMSSNDTALPALRKKLPVDLTRDLAAVTLVTAGPMALVVPAALPARNVKELIAHAHAQPGKLTFGSGGVGGTVHLTGELFTSMAKMKVLHVPYKGSADILAAMLGGQVDFSFPSITIARPLMDAGRVRALAVTSTRRASSLPAVPTLDEAGLAGFDRTAWYGVAAPAGVTKSLIARLNGEIVKVVATPEMKELFNRQGLEVQTNTPEQFAAFIKSEIRQNGKLVESAGVSPE
ncbi:MAG: tripartite tricarboxylate transporter substrate binding protein [Burkholderiales bacterium]|nr:tripartite tricarboxylate transporter substrate binding protein [Burkholderiales bacterium]